MTYHKFDDDKESRIKNRNRCHFWVEQLPDSATEVAEDTLKEICKHYVAIENSLNKTLSLPFEAGVGGNV